MPTPAKNFHGVGIGPLSKILAVKGEQGNLKAALNQELERRGTQMKAQPS